MKKYLTRKNALLGKESKLLGIGETIVESINEQGLKKCAVAQRAGIRLSRFSQIIHNKQEANAKEIISICNVLQITPNKLFGVSEAKKNDESVI